LPQRAQKGEVIVNGRTLTGEEFLQLFEKVRNWGRWGDDDEMGALHHLGEAEVVHACRLPRRGLRVSLGRAWDGVPGVDNAKPALHHMTSLGDRGGDESANTDFIGIDFHGKAASHLDALAHYPFRGRLYNGRLAGDVVSSAGASFGSVTALSRGVVARGVLLDAARVRGVEWIDPPCALGGDDLEAVATALGVEVRRGDVVLLRSGAVRRRRELGPWDLDAASVGLAPSAVAWLGEVEAAMLGGDGDSDARPSTVEGVVSPVHVLAITGLGMCLLDNLDLESLSEACADAGSFEFLLVVAPLIVPGGTGSPVNPVAVL
jgi:kynurenine formamidase